MEFPTFSILLSFSTHMLWYYFIYPRDKILVIKQTLVDWRRKDGSLIDVSVIRLYLIRLRDLKAAAGFLLQNFAVPKLTSVYNKTLSVIVD